MKRTVEDAMLARSLYEAGHSLADVAQKLSVAPRTAMLWVRAAGGKTRSLKKAWKLRKARKEAAGDR